MNLIDFYIKVIKSLHLEVIDDVVCDGEDPLTIGGIPVALPTNNIVNKMLNPDGSKNYIMFNPILEEVYTTRKNSNVVLQNLLAMAKLNLNVSATYLTNLLMGSTELKQCSMNITNFIKILYNEVNNTSIKKIVDEKAVHTVYSIMKDGVENGCEPLKIVLNKNEKVNNSKYGRVCSIYSPLLDYILEEEKKVGVNKLEEIKGHKTRPKDVAIVKAVLKYLLLLENDETEKRVGSNSNQPGLEALLNLYVTYATWFNTLAEDTAEVDLELSQDAKINLQLTEEDIENIHKIETEAKLYPGEGTINLTVPKQNTSIRDTMMSKLKNNWEAPAQNAISPIGTSAIASTTQPLQSVEPELTEYQKALMAMNGKTSENAVHHEIPSLANYVGPRPDLHVSNIYSEALRYDPAALGIGVGISQYNPTPEPSRFGGLNGTYLTLEQRMAMEKQNSFTNPYLR